jgi:hypothetical protein
MVRIVGDEKKFYFPEFVINQYFSLPIAIA